MITVTQLQKTFKTTSGDLNVLNNLSFHVKAQEIYGIIGLSGAGKSTLLRCLNRLEKADKGTICINQHDMMKATEKELLHYRKEIAMIFQHFNLFNQYTVFENVAYPLKLIKTPPKEIRQKVQQLLQFVDLSDKINTYPHQLSGGQKQRVAIARALICQPKVLLCDEATSALDPISTKVILGLLKKAVAEMNLTILLITHQMEVAQEICDTIAVMENGQFVEINQTKELFAHPKHPLTKAFIEKRSEDEMISINTQQYQGYVLRLSFSADNAKEPIIAHLVKQFNIDINIISGDIKRLATSEIGMLYIEIQKDKTLLHQVVTYLAAHHVYVEVLNV